jgi:D-lactate dehydrogenase
MKPNIKIAFFDTKPYDENSFIKELKDPSFEITYFRVKLTEKNAKLAEGHDVVCAFVNDTLNATVLDKLVGYGIQLVAMRCAGYNNVDIHHAYDKIHIVRVPAYSPYAIAEHAAALILSLNRKIHRAYYRTRDNNFSIAGFEGFDLHGKTAGVIGTGRIGQIMIGILQGFGMKILAYDKFPNTAYAEKAGIEYVELDTIYRQSDIISLHCPLTSESHHMINRESIEKMKPEIMLINTSRGHLIDTSALIDALKESRIGSAGLDVYEEEADYFFEDFSGEIVTDDILARLLTFNNVLITSHQAFLTREALSNIATTTIGNIKEFFSDGFLANEICYQCDKGCPKKEGKRCFNLPAE